jgi:DNA topoisomerase-1
LDVTEEQAIEIIKEKRQKDKDKIIRIFDENPDARIENGRWGPFVRFGKQNLKIPKGTEVEKITYADVLKWAEEDPKASKSAKKTTKTATKKATTKKK